MSDEPSTWEEAKRIFQAALDISDARRRSEFVAAECGDREEILREVETLLLAHPDAADFLEEPASGSEAPRPVDPLLGRRIGGCRITEAIAVGGMGRVYAAEQDHPRRKVALKLLRWPDPSSRSLRRFEYEAQVLGRLRHPGIAQVFAAGVDEDLPFIAMEYVPGARTITAALDEAGAPLPRRLELFLEVCDAVEEGHRRGIIHRDLKPANLLVGRDGRAKVIDFGVARSVDSDAPPGLSTADGSLVGTLQYMAPEQVDGDARDIDLRCDVYALGIVLYQILCKRLPYDLSGKSLHDAVRTIREAPPAPTLPSDACPRDLVAIVHMALAKDRNQRYASVGALAEDLRRYLADEPVRARPPSWWRSLRSGVRRHRTASAAAAAVLLSALGGAVLSWSSMREAHASARSAQSARTETEIQFERLQAVRQFLHRALAAAHPGQRRGETDEIHQLLDPRDQDLEVERPEIEAELRTHLGALALVLDHQESARTHLERALRLRLDTESATEEERAETYFHVAVARQRDGELDSALAAYSEARRRWEELRGAHSTPCVEVCISEATCLWEAGEQAPARELAESSLERARKGGDAVLIAECLHTSAQLRATEDPEEAIRRFREALRLRRQLYSEDHPLIASTLSQLGALLSSQGHRIEGGELQQQALEIRGALVGGAAGIAQSLCNEAMLRSQSEEYEDTSALGRAAAWLYRKTLGDDHTYVAKALLVQAIGMRGAKDVEGAHEIILEALEILGQRLPPGHPELLNAQSQYGDNLTQLEDYESAEDELLEVYEALEADGAAEGNRRELRDATIRRLIRLYLAWGDPDEADRWRERRRR